MSPLKQVKWAAMVVTPEAAAVAVVAPITVTFLALAAPAAMVGRGLSHGKAVSS
jgi:hypothetical protein